MPDVDLSRSRAYHKSDNRFVEERNRTVVRSWVGEGRLDTVVQTVLLNRIDEKLWCYHNLFLPVLRLASKEPVLAEGCWRVRRVYERACTPSERLEARGAIAPKRLEALKRLRAEIYALLGQLFALPCARVGEVGDVFETLGLASTLPAEVLAPVTLSFDG